MSVGRHRMWMNRGMVLAGLLSLSSPAQADTDCEVSLSPSTLDDRAETAEYTYGRMEVEDFTRQVDALLVALECMDSMLTSPTIARIHRLVALRAFVSGDSDSARQAFAASRMIDPRYRFPPTIVPDDPNYPEWDLLEAVPLAMVRHITVAAPENGTLYFDGTETLERPISWSTVLQIVDQNGFPTVTEYLTPQAALPPEASPGTGETEARNPMPRILAISGGLVLTGGLGLYASGWSHWNNDCKTSQEGGRYCPGSVYEDTIAWRFRGGVLLMGVGGATLSSGVALGLLSSPGQLRPSGLMLSTRW